jgi:hypothetical protein
MREMGVEPGRRRAYDDAARRRGRLRRSRMPVLNRLDRAGGGGEAVVEYLDSNLKVLRPGSFVRCAVTGEPIPLEQLRYWSVERQEAYASPEAVLKRLGVTRGARR